MHELSLAREMVRIVEQMAEQEHFSKVERIHLALGALSCVSDESLRFAFDAVRTPLVGEAELAIEKVPASAQCSSCGRIAPIWQRLQRCEGCGGEMLALTGGDAMRITDLEVC